MNKLATIAMLALMLAVVAGACTDGEDNCVTCTGTACTECAAGFGPTEGACVACADGTGTNGDGECEDCAAHCGMCTDDSTACTECDEGYGLSAGKCVACAAGTGTSTADSASKGACGTCSVKNCQLCTNDMDSCTSCKGGFGAVNDECKACTKDTNCDTCDGDVTVCDACKAGTAANDDDVCTACSNGCASCEKVDDSCTACASGQILNKTDTKNQFCCPVNCTTCKAINFCTGCIDGANLNADKGTCFGFKTGASLTLGAIISVALFSLLF